MATFDYLDLLGKNFEYGARGPEKYDCYGLMIEARRRVGLFMPEDYASTNLPEVMHDSIEHAKRGFPFRELPAPEPFCLATFRLHPRYTTHIGMVLEDGYRFIHILPKLRVAVERLDSPCWSHRITGFWETPVAGMGERFTRRREDAKDGQQPEPGRGHPGRGKDEVVF